MARGPMKQIAQFPLWSALSLTYPAIAFLSISRTPAQLPERIGYALANLGYLLLAAAAIAGTFRALGLRKRSHVLAAAAISWLVGVILSNLR